MRRRREACNGTSGREMGHQNECFQLNPLLQEGEEKEYSPEVGWGRPRSKVLQGCRGLQENNKHATTTWELGGRTGDEPWFRRNDKGDRRVGRGEKTRKGYRGDETVEWPAHLLLGKAGKKRRSPRAAIGIGSREPYYELKLLNRASDRKMKTKSLEGGKGTWRKSNPVRARLQKKKRASTLLIPLASARKKTITSTMV